ncbi:hypothetical protein LCER1_G002448 [Lachnellula cervina]|uniref:Protein DSF2 n=1 Tax=Lachnellula cervina TaxID=1316786 RepID=A0A7D8YP90_9HELO|nr:hypothetical protein LCER1_G002448 [Lachnellula cervina]
MPFKDLLRKKEKLTDAHAPPPAPAVREPSFEAPQFTFMRSDTHTQEIISPPTFSSANSSRPSVADAKDSNAEPRTSGMFKGRSRSKADSLVVCSSSAVSTSSHISTSDKSKPKRLSERFHLRKSQITSTSVPSDLPEISVGDGDAGESQWEKRATILARENERSRSRPVTPTGPSTADLPRLSSMTLGESGRDKGAVLTQQADDDIQEAIRLHEAGELETSTRMFGRLADPNGENNALSQVLYGLALRSGWGCTPDPGAAVRYLSAAASNAALIEELALKAGMKKGGAAKGELVLAIFELANCFRYGWGVTIDKLAAKQYYETAANLGDTDAMNEVAWCYVEGFGCKKDKWAAAKYYRLAEQSGSKTLGNSWRPRWWSSRAAQLQMTRPTATDSLARMLMLLLAWEKSADGLFVN